MQARVSRTERDRRERRWSQVSWAVIVVVLGAAGVLLLSGAVPRSAGRWLAPLGVVAMAAIPFAPRARTDPVWYASVVGPALALTLAGQAVGWPLNELLAAAGILFTVPFWCGPRAVTDWWWSTVLRRPRWSAGRWFDRELRENLERWAEALAGQGPLTPEQELAAQVAVDRIVAMKAPVPAWSDLRDAYVRNCRRWIETPRDDDHAAEWAAINAEFEGLDPRRLALVEATR